MPTVPATMRQRKLAAHYDSEDDEEESSYGYETFGARSAPVWYAFRKLVFCAAPGKIPMTACTPEVVWDVSTFLHTVNFAVVDCIHHVRRS